MNPLCGKHTENCCWFPKCIAGGRPGQKAAFYWNCIARGLWHGRRSLAGWRCSQLQAVFSGYGMVTKRTFAPAIPCVPRGSANPHAGAPTVENLAGELGRVRKQTERWGTEIRETERSRPTRKLATTKPGE